MVRISLRLMVVTGLLNACTAASPVAAAPSSRPTAAAVYEQLERLWKEGDVEAFAGYIDGLKRDYPGYVPTRLAGILMDAIDHAPYEKVAADLTALAEELDPLLPWVSPDFEDDIRTKIRYYTDFAELDAKHGNRRDGILRRPNSFQGDLFDLGFIGMFVLAPEIVLPFQPGDWPRPLKLDPVAGESNNMDYEGALAILRSPAEAPASLDDFGKMESRRRAAVGVLGASQRPEAIEDLCAVITSRESDMVASARAAEAVSVFGEAAVPALLDALQHPELRGFSNEKKRLIWALVRTGVRRPDIGDTVKQEVEKVYLLRHYAERALRYIGSSGHSLVIYIQGLGAVTCEVPDPGDKNHPRLFYEGAQDEYVYAPGQKVTLTAHPPTSGWKFDHWLGASNSVSRRVPLVMDREHEICAVFVRDEDPIDMEDPDKDYLPNYQEAELGTNPDSADTDGDGLPDWWEVARGLDPLSSADNDGATGDPDGDGVDNITEFKAWRSSID
jgi:hypothetical protein